MPAYWKYRMKHNFFPALKEFRDKNVIYLEIGLLAGITIEWMFKNILVQPGSIMIGIDPILDNVKWIKEKYGRKVQLIQGLSQDVIPRKARQGKWLNESIDIIYIDGDHSPSVIKQDFYNCWNLLKINGVLIFDDYLLKDKKTGKNNIEIRDIIDKIILECSKKLNVIFTNRQLGIRKIAA
jgi:predicted O-methyltransferase YrrM